MKVIHEQNMPSRYPIWSALTCWLMLDKFNAPAWGYIVLGALFLINLLSELYKTIKQEKTDIFKDSK